MLDYHVVLATEYRKPLFDEAIAPGLFNYILTVGEKHGFLVDRIGLLPDHMHLIIQAVPNLSIQDCVLAIMNNTRYWMTKHYSGVLKQTDACNVWNASFYAGTVGEYSTAQVKRFLSGR
jgi:putative transposase